MRTLRPAGRPASRWTMSIELRPDPWYLFVVRVAGAEFAARAGLDDRGVNDMRVVATELGSMLLDRPADGAVAQIDFGTAVAGLRVLGSIPTKLRFPPDEEVATMRLLRDYADTFTAVVTIDRAGERTLHLSAMVGEE